MKLKNYLQRRSVAALFATVAQIVNLLYRRLSICEAFNDFKAMPRNPRRRPVAAFTLIELLVVIAIIGILAALVFPVIGAVNKHKQISLAQTEMQQLVTAIDGYKTKLGYYPPDNPNNPVTNQLYFELMGTTNNTTSTVAATFYGTLDGTAQISTANMVQYFAPQIQGFANSSTRAQSDDTGSAASTFLTHLLPKQYGPMDPANGSAILFLKCAVDWPANLAPAPVAGNPTFNPWRYVSTHPTNNTGSYDLWVDLVFGHTTNRICNWSTQPIQL